MATATESNRAELVEKLRLDRGGDAPAPRRRRLLAGVVVVAAAGFGAWALAGRSELPEVQTAVVRSAAEMPADASVLDASGYVTARREATVSAKITGKVTEVLLEEGMHVDEGAVLARLDDSEARAQLELAQAQLAAARSELAVLRSDLGQAERDFTRQEHLVKSGSTSTQEMERARSGRDTLRARVANTEEQIKVAAEQVDVAQVQLDNTEVRAPFAGIVVAKSAQPGEMISPISAGGGFTRTGIGTIVDMDSLEFEIDVNESFIGRVSPQQRVSATLNAYPDWKIPGHVIAVIPTADRSKATIKVRVAIDTKDPRIVPDMGVRVAFLAMGDPRKRDGVFVPNDAVVEKNGESIAFVVSGGRVERRRVTLGERGQSDLQVTSGLAAGERVVVSPVETLADGIAVRVADGGGDAR